MSHWFSFTLLTGKSGKCRFQRLQFIISRLLHKGNNRKVKAPSIFTINAWCVFRMQPAAANADARLQLHSCSTETHFQWWSIVFCSCLLLFLELLFYQGILKPQKWPSPKWASHSRYRVKCNQELTATPNLDLTPQKDHCGPPRTFRNVFSGPRYLAFTRTHTHKHTLLHTPCIDECLVLIRREPQHKCDLLHCCSGSAARSLTSLLSQWRLWQMRLFVPNRYLFLLNSVFAIGYPADTLTKHLTETSLWGRSIKHHATPERRNTTCDSGCWCGPRKEPLGHCQSSEFTSCQWCFFDEKERERYLWSFLWNSQSAVMPQLLLSCALQYPFK